MNNSRKPFYNNDQETISASSGKSFFRLADLDLSDEPAESKKPSAFKSTMPTFSAPAKEPEKPVKPVIPSNVSPKKPRDYSACSDYEKFRYKREDLTLMFNQAADIMHDLDMHQIEQRLSDLREKVKRDAFKIQIVGNFKNGKSTFINSFLGEDVLPAYALPCTAVINEVKYGEEKRAVIHFKNPLPSVLPSELSPAALNHIKKHSDGKIPPMEISYDKIEEYVVIPVGKDPKDMMLESPYERVELFWPLELLKNGIEIIDSPGLNEHTTRTKVTMDFLSKSDAIIFVLNATMLCSRDEMTFIENCLHSNGFKDLFFVVNRFDMIPEDERERIMGYARKNLVSLTNLGEKGLFFVSAKKALEAKMNNDKESLVSSGLPKLESTLSSFLTVKKGAVKLTTPARALFNFLQGDAMTKILPQQHKKLSLSADEIKKEQKEVQSNIDALERKKQLFTSIMQADIDQLNYFFNPIIRNNLLGTADSVYDWITNYEPTQKLGLFPSKERVGAITEEILEQIRLMLDITNADRFESAVYPEINAKSNYIFDSTKSKIKSAIQEYGDNSKPQSVDVTSSVDTFKEMNSRFFSLSESKALSTTKSKQLTVQLTGQPLLGVMSAFSSPTVKAKIISQFSSGFAMFDSSALPRLKTVIAQEVAYNIKLTSAEYASSVTREIINHFSLLEQETLSPIDSEISALENKLDSVSLSTQRHKSDIDYKKEQLNQLEKDIKLLCNQLKEYNI